MVLSIYAFSLPPAPSSSAHTHTSPTDVDVEIKYQLLIPPELPNRLRQLIQLTTSNMVNAFVNEIGSLIMDTSTPTPTPT
ncbi:hypothetical protein EON65_16150, partial [archaeon]